MMKLSIQQCVVIVFVIFLFALGACQPAAKPTPIPLKAIPPGSTVAGKTIGEWSAEWWKWAYSHSVPDDPFTDTSGEHANRNQSGPVFFLAYSPGDNLTRSFTVPANKYLLIPMIAGSCGQDQEGADKSVEDLRKCTKEFADLFNSLFVKLDGQDLPDVFQFREISPEFSLVGAHNNIFALRMGGNGVEPEGESGITVADGYFVMLEPPEPGTTHKIEYGGVIGDDLFKTNNAVTITIGAEN